jgi:threonine aldolase
VIDLRSDTLSRPTAQMLEAMVRSPVGDEQKREDPTVIALEERVASLLGKDASVFVPTATMANQIALRTLTRPGDEVIADAEAHIYVWELAGPAVHSGLAMKALSSNNGHFSAEAVEQAFVGESIYRAPTRLLCVENTHAESGGRPWRPAELESVIATTKALGLRLHLDGARLLHAAVAIGLQPAEIAGPFDTVTFCLTKGLGCPVGALLAGDADVIESARRQKQLFGGAMRQAGVIAGAGLYALDHHIDRLVDDHEHARLFAASLAGASMLVASPETNMVLIDVGEQERAAALQSELRAAGVALSTIARPGVLRAVFYIDITTDQAREAAERTARVLAPTSTTARSTG